jgi:lipopolysaccharide export system protein LptA
MQMEPHPLDPDQVILKLGKGISAKMTGFGTMTADSLELYANLASANQSAARQVTANIPGADSQIQKGQKSNLTLDHAVVKDNVVFETAAGTCKVKQFNIFFTNIVNGKAFYSRWMPQMLVAKPPVAPYTATSLIQRPSPQSAQQPIQQVQYLQPLSSQPPQTPLAPIQSLYTPPAAATAPAYGNIPKDTRPVVTPTSMPKGFVETQNLLGIKSSPNGGKFEITGDRMKMEVVNHEGQSSAEVIALEGNVHLIEKTVTNVPGTAIEIIGDTVTIWSPSDPTTQIHIASQTNESVFKGKGVELRAKELGISRPENKFWSPGAGRLIANAAQISTAGTLPGNTGTGNPGDKLIVEWNKGMVCDGLVLQFGPLDGKGSRVQTRYQTYKLWCNFMEIELNRRVMFFDDQSSVEPEAKEIRCVHDVHVQNEQFNAQQNRKSIDIAKAERLHYEVKKDYFAAYGPGELSSMRLGSEQGFDPIGQTGSVAGGEKLNYLAVWFQDTVQGTLGNNKVVDVRGRVKAVYCPAASWQDTIAFENAAAARKTGYLLDCEVLRIAEVPNPVNLSQSSMELTASTNASIDGGGMFGKAQKISYNQAKSLVSMEGNVNITATIEGKTSEHRGIQSIRYNLETRRFESMQVQGGSIGQ